MSITNKVSIIVPCYNQARYLSEALESILNQSYTNWECIIVDDGSPDNTEEVAREWLLKDNRFKYLKKENGGLSSARNAGIKNATGDFIQFLDSDDLIDSKKIELQVNLISDSVEIVFSDYFPFDNETKKYLPSRHLPPFYEKNFTVYDLVKNWESRNTMPCHTVLFKKSLLYETTSLMFDENLLNHEDWHFWVLLFHRAKGFKYLDEKLASYRIHKSSMIHNKSLMKKGFLNANKVIFTYFNKHNDLKGKEACLFKVSEIKKLYPSINRLLAKKIVEKAKSVING